MQACVCALPLGQAVSMLTASDTSEAADSESTAATADSPSAAATADSSSEEKTSAAASEVIGSAGHGHSSLRTCCFDWCIHTRPVIHSSLCSQGIVTEDQGVPTIQKNRKRRIQDDHGVQSGPQIRRHRHRVGLRRTEGWTLALHECVTCMACKFLIFMSMMTWCFTVMKTTTSRFCQ